MTVPTTKKATTVRPGARKAAAAKKAAPVTTTAPTTGSVVTVELAFTKETPGTYRYDVDPSLSADAPVTSLYVRKAGFPDGAPTAITVTVTPA